jgi:hypothetical protein
VHVLDARRVTSVVTARRLQTRRACRPTYRAFELEHLGVTLVEGELIMLDRE